MSRWMWVVLVMSGTALADVAPFPGTGRLGCQTLGFETRVCDSRTNIDFDACESMVFAEGMVPACADRVYGGPFRHQTYARPGLASTLISLTPWRLQLGAGLSILLIIVFLALRRSRK